jgi:hypothetical protein
VGAGSSSRASRAREGYASSMCSHEEWQKLRRSFEQTVEAGDLRDLVSEAAARVEALIDELKIWTCPAENAEWVRGSRRRSRPEWVV